MDLKLGGLDNLKKMVEIKIGEFTPLALNLNKNTISGEEKPPT